ncbi:MAG: hypothetical protein WH035_06685 [Spirochaetota bacterium]
MPINEEVRKIVDELTNNFSIDTLTTLFRIIKNDTFNQNIQKIFFDNQNKGLNNEEKKDQWLFDYGHFVGDLKIDEGDLSIVCVKVTKELSEKSGKKKQYEFA